MYHFLSYRFLCNSFRIGCLYLARHTKWMMPARLIAVHIIVLSLLLTETQREVDIVIV